MSDIDLDFPTFTVPFNEMIYDPPPRDNWPVCAKCRRLVGDVIVSRDFDRRVTIITVKCHGAEDKAELPDTVAIDAKEIKMSGYAFAGYPAIRGVE